MKNEYNTFIHIAIPNQSSILNGSRHTLRAGLGRKPWHRGISEFTQQAGHLPVEFSSVSFEAKADQTQSEILKRTKDGLRN
jgi:hypothetical protein